MEELDYFRALNGRRFQYVGMNDATTMKVWEVMKAENGITCFLRLGGLEVYDVDMETLKSLKVWDELANEVKKEINEGITKKTQAVHENMEKIRRGRKSKYPNVPRELVCIKCSSKKAIQPALLISRVEKIAKKKGILFTINDYVKVYQCKKCIKGDKVDDVVIELVCSCGTKVSVVTSILVKRAERLGVKLEDYIKNFKCQACENTKGRKSTGKCIPIDLVCKCGNKVTYPTSAVKKMAEKKGKTLEEYVKGYACQKCCPTPRGRSKKIKS